MFIDINTWQNHLIVGSELDSDQMNSLGRKQRGHTKFNFSPFKLHYGKLLS